MTRQSSPVSNEDEEPAVADPSGSRSHLVGTLKSVFASRHCSHLFPTKSNIDTAEAEDGGACSNHIRDQQLELPLHSSTDLPQHRSIETSSPKKQQQQKQQQEQQQEEQEQQNAQFWCQDNASCSYEFPLPSTSGASLTSSVPGTSRRIEDLPVRSDNLVSSLAVKKPNISKAQMKEFREAFRLFDNDGDGTITKDELGRVMRSLGQFARAEELSTMLDEIDIDGDGNVSFEEFVEIVSNIGGSASSSSFTDQDQEEQELRDAFRVFDKHNRGYITASDLQAVLQCLGKNLSEDEIQDMIKEVDVDGDGRIDFYEFVHALGEPGIDDDDDDEDDDYEYEEGAAAHPQSLKEL